MDTIWIRKELPSYLVRHSNVGPDLYGYLSDEQLNSSHWEKEASERVARELLDLAEYIARLPDDDDRLERLAAMIEARGRVFLIPPSLEVKIWSFRRIDTQESADQWLSEFVDAYGELWTDEQLTTQLDRDMYLREVADRELVETMGTTDPRRRFELASALADRTASQLGVDDDVVLAARAVMGCALLEIGQSVEALCLLEGVVPRLETLRGAEDVFSRELKANLGLALARNNRGPEAVNVIEESLRALEGNDLPVEQLLMLRRHLAHAYRLCGRKREARQLADNVVAEYDRHFGRRHPETIRVRHQLSFRHGFIRRVLGAH